MFSFPSQRRSKLSDRASGRKLQIECLEPRALLHGVGLADPHDHTAAAPVTSNFTPAAFSASALLPDLIPWASQEKGFVYDWRVLGTQLRLTTAMANIGTGKMELRGGDIHGDRQDVWQRIYEPNGSSTDTLVGSFIYHPEHAHIHFEEFAEYRLRAVDANAPNGVGAIIRSGEKVSFCLLDVEAFNTSLPNAPNESFYRTCGQVQGISVGWADVYDRGLPGQSIDINGLPNGTYWLEVEVDPANHLVEANEANNVTRIQINLITGSPGGGIPLDTFEPNDSFNAASILAPPEDHTYSNLSIHKAKNSDWYRVSASASGDLSFRATFSDAAGNIEMQVFNANNSKLGSSKGNGDSEQISVEAEAGEYYYVRVFADGSDTNPNYSLFIDQPDHHEDHNEAPTLTAVNTLTGAQRNTPFVISYATLLSASNAADANAGTVLQFRITKVNSGSLQKISSTGAVTNVVVGTTLLGPGESLRWTPTNSTGVKSAFKIKAFDGSLDSSSAVQVKVNVAS